jgi:predicted nucleic acid-binding protein
LLYCDSSAWVKRYVEESGTEEVRTLFRGSERIGSSRFGYIEVVAALSRRIPTISAESQLTADWAMMFRLPITETTVVLRAVEIAREDRLRAADAVHLATAMDWREDLAPSGERVVFVACDLELLAVAEGAGFAVLNPART